MSDLPVKLEYLGILLTDNKSTCSCFPDEIVDNPNREEVKAYLKDLTKSNLSCSNFPYDNKRNYLRTWKVGEKDPAIPIVPKGAGCYDKMRMKIDFADKAERGVGLSPKERLYLANICSIGMVHLCYLEETRVYGPIELLEIKARCMSCSYSCYMQYERNKESEIFKMFKAELPDIYEKLRKEYRKRIKKGLLQGGETVND